CRRDGGVGSEESLLPGWRRRSRFANQRCNCFASLESDAVLLRSFQPFRFRRFPDSRRREVFSCLWRIPSLVSRDLENAALAPCRSGACGESIAKNDVAFSTNSREQ